MSKKGIMTAQATSHNGSVNNPWYSGVGYVNSNNDLSNANWNIGCRDDSVGASAVWHVMTKILRSRGAAIRSAGTHHTVLGR